MRDNILNKLSNDNVKTWLEAIECNADYQGIQEQVNKLKEEMEEVRYAISNKDIINFKEEVGDVVNVALSILYLLDMDDTGKPSFDNMSDKMTRQLARNREREEAARNGGIFF